MMHRLLVVILILASAALAQDPAATQAPITGSAESGTETATEEAPPMSCMGAGGGITGLLPIVGMIAIFYFLIIRPQQKQQKRLREMRSSLERGDKVVTAGGIHGVITNMRNEVVTLKIADNVKIDVDRNSLTLLGQQEDSGPDTR
jgi:preprotein translocase subunit YajC